MSSKSSGELTLLIAAAAVLGVLDGMIPKPLPFMKLGLANVASVLALTRFGYLKTLELNVIRAVAVGLISGMIATPTFLLSISGALASATVMAAVQRLFRNNVSLCGISAAGGVSSLWAQLLAAGLVLHDIPVRGILIPLTIWGIVSGVAVGAAAAGLRDKVFRTEVLQRAAG